MSVQYYLCKHRGETQFKSNSMTFFLYTTNIYFNLQLINLVSYNQIPYNITPKKMSNHDFVLAKLWITYDTTSKSGYILSGLATVG